MTSVRDISRIITKARTRDEEQTQKYNAMVAEPARERLLPELRRRRAQVRGQQPLEGLSRLGADHGRHDLPAVPPLGRRAQRSQRRRSRSATAQKIRESIRDNIADIIAEESIIGKRPRPDHQGPDPRHHASTASSTATTRPGVGQGDGDIAARPGRRQGSRGEGQGQARQGRRPARASTTTRPTSRLEELIDIMFEDLELPDLERKALRQIAADAHRRSARATARSASASASTSAAPPARASGAVARDRARRHADRAGRRAAPSETRASPSTTTT